MAEKKKKSKVLIIFFILILLVGLVAGGIWVSKKTAKPLKTFEVKRQNLKETIEVSGSVESKKDITIKTSTTGIVIKRLVQDNFRVKEKTPILEVDPQLPKLQVNQAKINASSGRLQAETELANAERALQDAKDRKKLNVENLNNQINKAKSAVAFLEQEITRNEGLLKSGAITKQVVDNQKQQLEQSKIDLKTAIDNMEKIKNEKGEIITAENRVIQAKTALNNSIKQGNAAVSLSMDALQKTLLQAPFDGSITKWLINKGDYLVPGTAIAKFQDLNDIRLKLPINELDLPKINPKNEINIVFDAYPDNNYKGTIAWVSEISIADSQNVQSFPVEVSFDNKGSLIKPGMSGDAEITFSEKKNVLSIPLGAISKKDNKILVKVLENDKPKEVEIKAGVATLEYLEVLSGLKEGDKVILESQN